MENQHKNNTAETSTRPDHTGLVPFDADFVADALRVYAGTLTTGQLDGAGHYLPSNIDEQADLVDEWAPHLENAGRLLRAVTTVCAQAGTDVDQFVKWLDEGSGLSELILRPARDALAAAKGGEAP